MKIKATSLLQYGDSYCHNYYEIILKAGKNYFLQRRYLVSDSHSEVFKTVTQPISKEMAKAKIIDWQPEEGRG